MCLVIRQRLRASAALRPTWAGCTAGRKVVHRDRPSGHAQIMHDYFSRTPVYSDEVFQRRFRIPRGVISNLIKRCEASNLLAPKFDALGVVGNSREQKLTAALRTLAFGTASDATDEYCRFGASTAMCVMKKFCRAVIDGFSSQFLRPPSAPELIEICRLNSLRGFPGMYGSLDCTHWEWRACPKAYAGQFKGRYKKPSVVIEAVATYEYGTYFPEYQEPAMTSRFWNARHFFKMF
ncbi:TPA: hypothetical protein N0F65_000595 [Lagenidium giganteum]|uniref:Nuclease HARBI1 n=1 Tax=Lagenidium giganteum TaxID=4803 RepID=A0AAV2YGF1_9STRA|nr:TPA: hypothetical protein N0F65_000595 [Lagenidium giganteum]